MSRRLLGNCYRSSPPEIPRNCEPGKLALPRRRLDNSDSDSDDLENYLCTLRNANTVKPQPRPSPKNVIIVSDDHETTSSESGDDSDSESSAKSTPPRRVGRQKGSFYHVAVDNQRRSPLGLASRFDGHNDVSSRWKVRSDSTRLTPNQLQDQGRKNASHGEAKIENSAGRCLVYDSDESDGSEKRSSLSISSDICSDGSDSSLWKLQPSAVRSVTRKLLPKEKELGSEIQVPEFLHRAPYSPSPEARVERAKTKEKSKEDDRVAKLLSELRGLQLSSSDSDDDVKSPKAKTKSKPAQKVDPAAYAHIRDPFLSLSSDDQAVIISNRKPKARSKLKIKVRDEFEPATEAKAESDGDKAFVYALSACSAQDCKHADARRFVGVSKRMFAAQRDELSNLLFERFEASVFRFGDARDNVHIGWSTRLLKTSGRCKFKATTTGRRSAYVELSTKVCDSAERVRDTLLHELCHAASWIVNGMNDGHGPIWRSWTARVSRAYPRLPVVTRCHTYEIQFKYIYRCSRCGSEVKRHSKSVDMDRQVCGRCGGRFELFVNKAGGTSRASSRKGVQVEVAMEKIDLDQPPSPRTPPQFFTPRRKDGTELRAYRARLTPFAAFVKKEFAVVKSTMPGASHAEIMKSLGQRFKEAPGNTLEF